MKIFQSIWNFYLRRTNPVKWARHLGVNIGEHTMISPSVKFSSEPYLIKIGSNVQITSGVSIHTHGGGQVVRNIVEDFDCFGKVIIEDWVYIGSESIIMPGVTIGTGSLIAAGSVVTKSVESGVVVGGNPAKRISTVQEYLERNISFNVHSKGMSEKEKKKYLLSLSDDKFIKK